ncbi:MAG: hypothetical protein RI911_379 [Candidatus Parcubacteria bacterium]|jgi:tRNA-specific 2-thiouridylase
MKKRICVALSGGVDSAVSAALLKKEGHDIFAAFVKVWQPDFLDCTQEEDRKSAKRVAAALGVPFYVHDAAEEYKQYVVDTMTAQYAKGETPNPDILCNQFIKFGSLYRFAKTMGATHIATGHYAQTTYYDGVCTLKKARDESKDQVYFLAQVEPSLLPQCIFPVGGLLKAETRAYAHSFKLPVAEKKDSQGLCFMGMVDMAEFLAHLIPMQQGEVLNEKGDVIGTHTGATQFTIGQRHGFLIAHPPIEPLYVHSIDVAHNTITVSALYPIGEKVISLRDVQKYFDLQSKTPYTAQLRYHGKEIPCSVVLSKDGAIVHLEDAASVAPGQSCVVYQKNIVAMTGTVSTVSK